MDERIFGKLEKIRREAGRLCCWLPALAWLFLFLILSNLGNVDIAQAGGIAGLVSLISSCLLAILAFGGVVTTSWVMWVAAGGRQFPSFRLAVFVASFLSVFLTLPWAPPRARLFA